jgi:hypothetical protein
MKRISRRAVSAGVAAGSLCLALGLGVAAGQSATTKPVPQASGGGKVLAQGPGYKIVATTPAGGSRAASETSVTDAPLETLHEPIVCQGQRVLHIDNRDIQFDGNAITAEDGCEIHITNSRISAGGIAIRARNADVHIENSDIEGRKASIDAAGGARIYAEESTFKGAARRVGQASIHDLGNNNWD